MLHWIASLSQMDVNLTTTCKYKNFFTDKIYLEFHSITVFAFKVKVAVKMGWKSFSSLPHWKSIDCIVVIALIKLGFM